MCAFKQIDVVCFREHSLFYSQILLVSHQHLLRKLEAGNFRRDLAREFVVMHMFVVNNNFDAHAQKNK